MPEPAARRLPERRLDQGLQGPAALLDVPFYGPTINPSNNSNWPQLDVPEVNKAIEDARLVTDPDERAQA